MSMAKVHVFAGAIESSRSKASFSAGGAVNESVAVAGDDDGAVTEPVAQADHGGMVGQEVSPVLMVGMSPWLLIVLHRRRRVGQELAAVLSSG